MKVFKLSFLASILLLISSCTIDPIKDIKLVVDTDILKYTAMLSVADNQNYQPVNATVEFTGANADKVYELSGKREIKLVNGMIGVGLHPSVLPTSGNSITVAAKIRYNGYQEENVNVVFTLSDKNKAPQEIFIAKNSVSKGNPAPLPPLDVYKNVSLNFKGVCVSRKDLEIRPSVYVYFKESTASIYRYLGYMEKGNIKTNYCAVGKTYDFQIVFAGESHVIKQKIDADEYNLTIEITEGCDF